MLLRSFIYAVYEEVAGVQMRIILTIAMVKEEEEESRKGFLGKGWWAAREDWLMSCVTYTFLHFALDIMPSRGSRSSHLCLVMDCMSSIGVSLVLRSVLAWVTITT